MYKVPVSDPISDYGLQRLMRGEEVEVVKRSEIKRVREISFD